MKLEPQSIAIIICGKAEAIVKIDKVSKNHRASYNGWRKTWKGKDELDRRFLEGHSRDVQGMLVWLHMLGGDFQQRVRI
jgi:hypothetical protein